MTNRTSAKPPFGIEDIYPLSPMQQGMLFHALLSPGSEVYVEQTTAMLSGELEVEAFRQAWQRVMDRNPILRTAFVWEGVEEPLQVVQRHLELPLDVLDWRDVVEDERTARVAALCHDQRRQGFRLDEAPLLRLALVRIAEDAWELIWTHHHTLLDGWSLPILLREVFTFYDAYTKGKPLAMPATRPYRDYIRYLKEQRESDAEAFWRETLRGYSGPAPLGIEPAVSAEDGAETVERNDEQELWLSKETTAGLQELARTRQLTANTLVGAAWGLLLSRYSRTSDVVFGATVAGRPTTLRGAEGMVGLFINTLPVRVRVVEDLSLGEWLSAFQTHQAELRQYEHSPLVQIQGWSDVPRDTPLFDTLMVFENYPTDRALAQQLSPQGGSALRITGVRSLEQTNYPLTFVSGVGTALMLKISYDRTRYDDGTIKGMLWHLRTLLEAIPSSLERPVGALPFLTETEIEQILHEWNDTARVILGADRRISELVTAQSERTPDAIAVIWESRSGVEPPPGRPLTRTLSMTYGELNAGANQLACRLRTQGAAPGTIAALYMERSPQLVVGLLGVMKSGAAYLPLDPTYPAERIAFMLADSGATLVLTQPHLRQGLQAALPQSGDLPRIVCLDDTWEPQASLGEASGIASLEAGGETGSQPWTGPGPEDPVYVIYTSGSTGTPKGVIVPQRALSNHSPAIAELYGLDPGDRMLQFISPSFDAAGEEFWPPLISGAAIVLPGDERDQLGEPLAAFCERHGVTHLHLAAAVWHQWCDDLSDSGRRLNLPLKTLVVGGENPSPPRLAAWNGILNAPCRFINAYGPTETTITATVYATTSDIAQPARLPIGRAIPNVQMRVVDQQMRWLPAGVPGELLVGGAGVALGYLNRPELTAERFIDLPLNNPLGGFGNGSAEQSRGLSSAVPQGRFPESQGRFYRTGDLVRWTPDGSLVFAGRADDQIKIRGYRVEPGEVEAAIASLPGIDQVAVVGSKQGPTGTVPTDATGRLIAYVVPHGLGAIPVGQFPVLGDESSAKPPRGIDTNILVQRLRQQLPDHMIPTTWVVLPELPLTPSGKLDRRRLPEPEALGSKDEGARPQTPDEELLAGLYGSLLGVEQVGQDDSFFDLGGHSLLATRLISRVGEAFGVEVPLRALFETPTVAGMARLIAAARGDISTAMAPPIGRVPRGTDGLPLQPTPLSFGQQRLWFLDQLEPGLLSYNTPAAIRLTGDLDVDALRYALNEIVRRHEVLRTSFGTRDGEPVQVIATERIAHRGPLAPQPNDSIEVPVEDLTGITDARERETTALRLAQQEARKPFNLAGGPLLRVRLFKLGNHDHLAILTVHHIAADGWSLGILVGELGALYETYHLPTGTIPDHQHPGASPLPPLPDLPIQYADYAAWQRRWLEGAHDSGSATKAPSPLQAQLEYWKKQLAGLPARLDLPTDRPRPAIQSSNGSAFSFRLSADLLQRLRSLARQEGATLYMVLLAGYQTLLARYSGQSDVAVGSVVASRVRPELEVLIGFFVNTLVFRTRFDDKPTFAELLARVRETALGAYAHQDVPFEMLVDAVQPRRELSHTPLFQAALSLQNLPMPTRELPGLTMRSVEIDRGTAQFDMLLTFTELADGLGATWEFNTDLFDRSTIERMSLNLETLLSAAVADPNQPVADLPIISAAERELVLGSWNRTAVTFPADTTIHALIAEWATRTPDGIAVEFWNPSPGDVELEGQHQQTLSLRYAELNARANQLAHALRERGVGPDMLVGLSVERSFDMIVGILGILKAGGAYLPLDPNYPADRLAFMIADSGIKLLLTQQRLIESGRLTIEDPGLQIVRLDDVPEIFGFRPSGEAVQWTIEDLPPLATADHLAYCIYTSGSTGRPKGALLRHRGLCNLADEQARAFDIRPGKRVLQFSALSFDASVWEMIMALRSGATLVLTRQEILSSGPELLRLLRAAHITTVTLPPSLLAVLEPAALPELETVIAAGERCTNEIMQRWAVGRRFYNAYGPTETTVCASMHLCDPTVTWAFGGPPIGKPISNLQLYVVDANLQPQPIGVPGELLVGGVGVARGYLNRPELTSERFIRARSIKDTKLETEDNARGKSSKNNLGSSLLYRTGDLVRWLPSGELEFLGRIDDQVKVRGFRIELGEIETALREHPAVRDAVVAVRGDLLVGYVIPSEAVPQTSEATEVPQGRYAFASIITEEMRAHLRQRLPEYMTPSVFVTLQAFPLTPAGKVDRRALPAPDQTRREAAAEYIAPRTPVEEALATLCAELLDLERVGVEDNFFELGGHSLLATRLIARIRDAYHVELPLRTLFERPTVSGLAQAVEQAQTTPAPSIPQAPTITARSRDARRASRSALRADEASNEEAQRTWEGPA